MSDFTGEMTRAVAGGPCRTTSRHVGSSQAVLAARALGIGGTITTLHAVVDERAKELLGIPEEIQIVYAVPLGYPRGNFGPVTRKPLSEVASIDRWDNPIG